jgi:hypothetical protein
VASVSASSHATRQVNQNDGLHHTKISKYFNRLQVDSRSEIKSDVVFIYHQQNHDMLQCMGLFFNKFVRPPPVPFMERVRFFKTNPICASDPRRATLLVIRRALENAGVAFIDENGGGPGVRLRKPAKQKR